MLGLESKLWISERWGKERCSNKQGATGSFPLAPVSSPIWLQKSHKYEVFIWIHTAFRDFLPMPLKKRWSSWLKKSLSCKPLEAGVSTGDPLILCFEAPPCICCQSQAIAQCGPSHWVIPNFLFPNPFLHVIILTHWLPHNSVYKSSWLTLSSLTHLPLHNMIYSILEKFKSSRRWKPSGIAPCYSLFRSSSEGCDNIRKPSLVNQITALDSQCFKTYSSHS